MLPEYKPNSHKSKEEAQPSDKKIEKVVAGKVKAKKKSEIRKFADIFIPEDVESVKSYVVMDVLIPSLKKAIDDIVSNGIHMFLYGETGGPVQRTPGGRVNYNQLSSQNNSRQNYNQSYTRTNYHYDDVLIDNRGEAHEVLARMDELIMEYGMVSVADFYDLVGVTGNYTDNKYGWYDIRSAQVVRTRDGSYMIKLPRAVQLK